MPTTALEDRKRESIIILLGEAARFLKDNPEKTTSVLKMLLSSICTPSESVQQAIAECIPPLIKNSKDNVPTFVNDHLKQLFDAESYAHRRGAAFALAGIVKGAGIGALKDFNIILLLKEAIEDRRSYRRREGALLLLETFALILGRLFEPYVIQILPQLLICFSDPNEEVRQAASDTSRAIMSKLSAHCVKLVLPSLLSGLDDNQWRTKQGCIEMLGAMAYLAPVQLSTCLPTIVPRLANVLTDSHIRVQNSAKLALHQIGSVIKNPEIQNSIPNIIAALNDPLSKYQEIALNNLLSTEFVHFIDAPSLALIVPVIHRALKERSSDMKKKAAHIVANICSLTDARDLQFYSGILIPELKEILLDPVPEVRSVSSKALGTMVARMGEHGFEDLIPWLVQTLISETSSVDRSGAAQGLSEVIAALGVEKLQSILPEIIRGCCSPKPYIREGSLSLFFYLPTSFHSKFQPFIDKVIPCILQGLADEVEFVRDIALRSGRIIVQNFAKTSIDILLPELCKGLFDDNWRIRSSSVQLLGDLLYCMAGVSGKIQTGESENETLGTEENQLAIVTALGQEKRNCVLASLYIVRSDVNALVRQASLHVWKSIVSNTPRTIKEVMSEMLILIIDCLSNENFDQQQMGARTLADLVEKLGDKVLPEILPIMEQRLAMDGVNIRRGVCVGLCEILMSTGHTIVAHYSGAIIRCIKRGLCDDDVDVRETAARGFDRLFRQIGDRAVEGILPELLGELSVDSNGKVLYGLRELLTVRSAAVLNVLLPQLLHSPISESNARALSALIPVAGSALYEHLPDIISAFLSSFKHEPYLNEPLLEAMQNTVNTIDSEEGIRHLVDNLIQSLRNHRPYIRKGASYLLHLLCQNSRLDLSLYVAPLMRSLLKLYCDESIDVVEGGIQAVDSLFKSLKKDELVEYAPQLSQALRSSIEECKHRTQILPGLISAKVKDNIFTCKAQYIRLNLFVQGLSPILPVLVQGLLAGSPEVRESSAIAIGLF